MNKNKTLPQAALEIICKNRAVRTFIVRRSPLWFFNVYQADHMEYETAPFQYEMLDFIQREDWKLLCITSFRGSAKTTIMSQLNVLWSILGIRQSKFVLIISQTQTQAKHQMMNIRGALEQNDTLKGDLGPFKDESDQWGASSIVFTKLGARISVASVGEAIRGIKHLQHRPDLIIIDDPEDLQSAKTKEGRDKIYNWFKGEVMPIGSKRTRVVVLGNVVHEHCLTMRLKEEIADGTTSGFYREYPIIDESGNSTWPGQFSTPEDIAIKRKEIGNDRTWYREYLLKIVPEDDQPVKREWIQFWDTLPEDNDEMRPYRMSASAVDLGIKNNEDSDPTAIVSGHLYGSGTNARIFILPRFFNGRILYPDMIKKVKEISTAIGRGQRTQTFIEAVQAQAWAVQDLHTQGYPVSEFIPRGSKEDRLISISPLIQNGQVLFHRGCKEIIDQIVNLGLENHDDLCDALTTLVIELTKVMGHGTHQGFPICGGEPRKNINGSSEFKLHYGLKRPVF